MSILEALIEANNNVGGIKKMAFANLQEWNSFKDSFTFLEYPVNVVTPFTVSSLFKDNRIKDTVTIQGWMITRISEDTNDYRSLDLEPKYIDPMRQLAKKFVRRLLDSDIIDSEVTDVTVRIVPEYQWLNAHLFGVSYSVNLPISSRLC